MGATTSTTFFGIPVSKTSGANSRYNSKTGQWIQQDKYSIGPFSWRSNEKEQTAGKKKTKKRKTGKIVKKKKPIGTRVVKRVKKQTSKRKKG